MPMFDTSHLPLLRRDLLNRINERHIQWIKDSSGLYEMGGLSASEFDCDTFMILLGQLAGILAQNDIPATAVMRELMNFIEQVREQMKDD